MSDSVPPKLPPELFLRIQCPRCRHFQAFSLADKPKSHPECQHCKSIIPLPRLNKKVLGLEVVLKAYPPEPVKMRFPCPGCATFLLVSPEVAGHRRRCEKCHTWFRLDLIKENLSENLTSHPPPHNHPPNGASSAPPTPSGAFFMEIDEDTPPVSSHSSPGERQPHNRQRGNTGSPVSGSHHSRESRHRHSPPPPHDPIDEWDEEEPEDEDDFPVLTEHSETRYQSHVADDSNTPVLPYRLIYRTVAWSLLFGMPIFGLYMAVEHHTFLFLFVAFLCWFVPWLKIPGRLANLFMSLCIHKIRCPGCRQVYPAVGRWSCPCGYNSPREQNVFHFRCPRCREYFGGFNCSHCQSSILIR